MPVKKKRIPVKTFLLRTLESSRATVEKLTAPSITEQENCEILEESLCSEQIKSIHRYVSCKSRQDSYLNAWKDMVATVSANRGISYTDSYTTVGSVSSSPHIYIGNTLTKTGEFFFTPFSSGELTSFNPNTTTFTNHGVFAETLDGMFGQTVLAQNGCIYYLSLYYRSVVKYNPITNSIAEIGTNVLKGWRGGVVYKEYIYAVSQNNRKILKIDTRDDSYAFIDTNLNTYGWIGLNWAPNGWLYGIPCGYTTNHTCLIKINPKTDEIISLSPDLGSIDVVLGTLATNGCIYCMPNYSSSILKINTVTDDYGFIGSYSGHWNWSQACLAPNGCIYAMNDVAQTKILKLDPLNNDTITTFGSFSSRAWNGLSLGFDGKLYASPNGNTSVFILDPGSSAMIRNFKQSTILSPLMN